MFEKNDKQLLTARVITNVATIIFVVAIILAGIVLSILVSPLCLLIAVGGTFFAWLLWVMSRLALSCLCDIKLIRNKLYGVSNDNLAVFLKEKLTPEQIEEQQRHKAQTDEKIEKLKALRDSGVISEDEFQQEREKLLK